MNRNLLQYPRQEPSWEILARCLWPLCKSSWRNQSQSFQWCFCISVGNLDPQCQLLTPSLWLLPCTKAWKKVFLKGKRSAAVIWCAQETFVGRHVRAQELGASTWTNMQGMQEQQHSRFWHGRYRDSPTQMCVGTDLQQSCWCLPEPWAAQGICQVLGLATARLWI